VNHWKVESKSDNCPICKSQITNLSRNYQLEGIMNSTVELDSVSELICLDISTSMWYGDSIVPFLFGEQRISIAKKFIHSILLERRNSLSNEVGIVTFGSHPNLLVPFQVAKLHKEVANVEANEQKTALYDAVTFSMEELKKRTSSTIKRLILLTDGGENFSNDENIKKQIEKIKMDKKSLQIKMMMIDVAGSPNPKTKKEAEQLGFTYISANGKNIGDITKSFLNQFPSQKVHADIIQKVLNIKDSSEVESVQFPQVPDELVEFPKVPEDLPDDDLVKSHKLEESQ